MKTIRKILVVLMAFVFGLTAFACGTEDSSTVKLKISFFKAGFGDEWIYAIAEKFEEEHPGVKVVPEGHANMETLVKNRLEAGNPDKIRTASPREWP